MTKTIPCCVSPTEEGAAVRSTDILLNLLAAFLAPIFLGVTNGDISLARLAAIETVKDYRAQNHADLLAVAQVVAFGFATLGSLCLSMADNMSLSMVLRLRGNANALSRSGETHRRSLERRANPVQAPAHQPAQADDPSALVMPPPQGRPAEKPAAEPTPVAAPSASPMHEAHALWAATITEAAEQLAAELPHLSPTEQRLAAIQAAALSECASGLLSGAGAEWLEPNQDDLDASCQHPGSRDPLS